MLALFEQQHFIIFNFSLKPPVTTQIAIIQLKLKDWLPVTGTWGRKYYIALTTVTPARLNGTQATTRVA